MTRPNDIDFNFELGQHGWSSARLRIDGSCIDFRLTHVFNDPLDSLLASTIRIADGEPSATIQWSDEPGTYIISLTELKTERHLLSVQVSEYSSELPLYTPNDLVKTDSFYVARDFWIHLVHSELRKISGSFTYKHYRESRDYPFPRLLYNELELRLKQIGT